MLAVRSFSRLSHVDLGYRIENLLSFRVNLSPLTCKPEPDFVESCNVTLQRIIERMHSLPGVQNVAAVDVRPLSGISISDQAQVEGGSDVIVTSDFPSKRLTVSAEYFQTMKIPLLLGRLFTDSDAKGSLQVALVNDAMARKYFDGKPLGRRIRSGNRNLRQSTAWLEIVGVVGDTRDTDPAQGPIPAYYVPYPQSAAFNTPNLLVLTYVPPASLASAVKEQIWAVDRNAPVSELKTMIQVESEYVADPRFRAWLLGAFGGLALLLALVGISGLIWYSVGQRTQEIGVRMALGARPRDVLRLVVGEGLSLVAIGITIGVGSALAMTRLLRNLLFEINPNDPTTFIRVSLLIFAVGLIACLLPARRAAQVDPLAALRHE